MSEKRIAEGYLDIEAYTGDDYLLYPNPPNPDSDGIPKYLGDLLEGLEGKKIRVTVEVIE